MLADIERARSMADIVVVSLYYSLGNFISNQTSKFQPYTESGAIFSVEFQRKSPKHPVEIANVNAMPTWVNRPWSAIRHQYYVVPLAKTLESRTGPFLSRGHYTTMQESLDEMDIHLSSFLTETKQPLVENMAPIHDRSKR